GQHVITRVGQRADLVAPGKRQLGEAVAEHHHGRPRLSGLGHPQRNAVRLPPPRPPPTYPSTSSLSGRYPPGTATRWSSGSLDYSSCAYWKDLAGGPLRRPRYQ